MNAPIATPPLKSSVALIGPNSVIHLIPLLDTALGESERDRLMLLSGISAVPPQQDLMAETPAASLHQLLREHHPDVAATLTRRAGLLTGDHIVEHHIPVAAMRVMRNLPSWLAAPVLASVVEKHAWTFAGSGKFRVRSKVPLVFELHDNPVVRGEAQLEPICHWHAAVFERVFCRIVDPNMRCVETACCATGAHSCRFEIS